MYIKRQIEPYLVSAGEYFGAVILTGARQVGKTTLLRRLGELSGMGYVTLDDPVAREFAQNDPALFMQKYPSPVIIDEIQHCPNILPYIKMQIDAEATNPNAWQKNQKKIKFWLSGSQQFHVMRGVSESLAGRAAIFNLYGLSNSEINAMPQPPFIPSEEMMTARSKLTLPELYHRIWRGSLPMAATSPSLDKNLFYSSYTQTYIERDVRALSQVGSEAAFLRFLRAAAARTGQLLNISSIARDADVSPNTAKSWISILQTSGIIYLLQPFHTNLTKRLVKSPKLYFLDTGLCAWLTGWESSATLERGAMSGAILETWVISELLKSYSNNAMDAPFYFYRDKDQVEIDLIIIRDGVAHPVEIKRTASPSRNAMKISKIEGLLPLAYGALICLVGDAIPMSENCIALPASGL